MLVSKEDKFIDLYKGIHKLVEVHGWKDFYFSVKQYNETIMNEPELIDKNKLIELLESYQPQLPAKNNKAYYQGYFDGLSDCILLIKNPEQK